MLRTKQRTLLSALLLTCCIGAGVHAQDTPPALVKVEQVRIQTLQRELPVSGRIFSRHDANLGLTLPGELQWVLEPGTMVETGEIIAQLDQQPILLRKAELEHMAERERVNSAYLEKELKRLAKLRKDNNASERMVDEGRSNRDVSIQDVRSLQARIEQLDDELRRSQLVAPYAGVIAERHKRGGEYATPGDIIARLVDLDTMELRFQVPVVYLPRVSDGQQISFHAQGGQLLGEQASSYSATVRTIISAADVNSQTFEVRADLDPAAKGAVIAGQLVKVKLRLSDTRSTLQVPRDAIVLRAEEKYVFRITDENTAHKVMVTVGEGAANWVSVSGELSEGDWVAVRGIERLQDGQAVSRQDS